MKKLISVILVGVTMLNLASCSPLPKDVDNLRINFKQHKLSNFGYAAAVYEDRIYYVSNETGASGIYSMMGDGADVNLEVKHPDITGIQIQDGMLYFNGICRIKEQQPTVSTGTINNHALYCVNMEGRIAYLVNHDNTNFNLKSFYISQNGYSFFKYGALLEELYLYDPTKKESNSNLKNIVATISFEYIDDGAYKEDYYDKEIDGENNSEEVKKIVYEFGRSMIVAKPKAIEYESNKFENEDPYVLNSNTGELMLAYDRVQSEALKAYFMDNKNIYCSYKDIVTIVDKETYQVLATFRPDGISNQYNVTYMAEYGGDIYVIADYWKDQDNRYLPLMGEKLFVVNAMNYESREILDLGSGQRIIGMDENYLILLDNDAIYKLVLDNGQICDRSKICDAPNDINSKNHIIDYAGDWMFIYKSFPEHGAFTYGVESPGQQLLLKVNLKSGEIIYNDVELDFSALDEFKEK